MEATEMMNKNANEGQSIAVTPAAAFESLTADFFDEAICRQWILKRLHPDGNNCPQCGWPIEDEKRLQRFWSGKRLNCQHCNKFFTALTGTVFSGTHLSYQEIFMLLTLLGTGMNNITLAAKLGICAESVRLWRNKAAQDQATVRR